MRWARGVGEHTLSRAHSRISHAPCAVRHSVSSPIAHAHPPSTPKTRPPLFSLPVIAAACTRAKARSSYFPTKHSAHPRCASRALHGTLPHHAPSDLLLRRGGARPRRAQLVLVGHRHLRARSMHNARAQSGAYLSGAIALSGCTLSPPGHRRADLT